MTNLIFTEMELSGSFLIELEQFQDNRGFFARSWCQREFEARGLKSEFVQANISYNHSLGTLRGLHYQRPPSSEAKLVRCSKGAIYDVIIDLRPDSGTYLQWLGIELTAESYQTLYVPEQFAHGFLTLEDHTEVNYLVSDFYNPKVEAGVRWDDPLFGDQLAHPGRNDFSQGQRLDRLPT